MDGWLPAQADASGGGGAGRDHDEIEQELATTDYGRVPSSDAPMRKFVSVLQANSLVFCVDDPEFSDCEVVLGDKHYHLHRQLLARGSRSCGFFEGAFRKDGFNSSSNEPLDLTLLLPEACHQYFGDALEFLYGKDIEFSVDRAPYLNKIGDVLQGEALMQASSSAMDKIWRAGESWRAAAHLVDVGTQLESEGIVRSFLPRLLKVGAPRGAAERLLAAASRRFPALAAAALIGLVERAGWRFDASSVLANEADSCKVSHVHVAFSAEGAARLLPDVDGERTCTILPLCVKCRGSAIGVTTSTCDVLGQRHAVGGFGQYPGGWSLSLNSGQLWAEGANVGQVPSEARSSLSGTRISMSVDPKGRRLTFSCDDWSCSMEANIAEGPGLRFTVYACCGGTAYALA